MKILHTSDWHLGRMLYGHKRYDEFELFLDWLAECVVQESIDVLLVAGDIFDTTVPSHRAQEIYYRFLGKIAFSSCRHVVITAGNHDSPSFLDAPKDILRTLHVHVVGAATELEQEVIPLAGPDGNPEAIICAVPYLRDRDLRTVEAGEGIEEKSSKLIAGLKKHYADVCDMAETQRVQYGNIPLVAMGHLFTAGGKTNDDDGVRELYVGSLAHVGSTIFPETVDYVALGHLHIPQCVDKKEAVRYSGSPIPMGFGEAKQLKSVVIITFNGKHPVIDLKPIPCFQMMEHVKGDMEYLLQRIQALSAQQKSVWLEIEYMGKEIVADLREQMELAVEGSQLEIRRIINKRIVDRVMQRSITEETLDDLNEKEVFIRCLDDHDITEEERPLLMQSYEEILRDMVESDGMES
ncbi:MAG: exonuclease subunit SbcD [Spartobacteria bacterium]|nr:exonuclease subunit SbcD [Spartobacteria bacterium]